MAEEATNATTSTNTSVSTGETTSSSTAPESSTTNTGNVDAQAKTAQAAPVVKSNPAAVGDLAGKASGNAGVGGEATKAKPAPFKAPAAQAKQAESSADADRPVTRGELDAYYASKQAEAAKYTAVNSHQSTLANQVETIRSKAAEAFAALPEVLREPLINSTLQKYDEARLNAAYPEGHPLHGEVCGVLDQAGIDAVVKSAVDLKTQIQAANLLKIGQGANSYRASVAGNQAAQGQAQAPINRGTLDDYVRAQVEKSMQNA